MVVPLWLYKITGMKFLGSATLTQRMLIPQFQEDDRKCPRSKANKILTYRIDIETLNQIVGRDLHDLV